MTATSPSTAPVAVHRGRLVVAALLLTGLSMRTAVTSVGAALDELEDGLHAGGAMSGLITTMPVICFAAIGVATPRLARGIGAHRLLVVAAVITTLGLVVRPILDNAALFALLSVLALTGGAVSNVLMPSLVKLHFPDRVGTMTAVYSTALAVGATAAAGLTVPIGDATNGWRGGLASWAVITAIAIVPWLPMLADDRRAPDAAPPEQISMRALARSRTAWLLALFFGAQSMQAYICFGWFARFLTAHEISHASAGVMLAVFSAISIPISLLVPRAPERLHRSLVIFFVACMFGCYLLMAAAPRGGAWFWIVLAGFGNGSFPLILTLLGTRARTPMTTAALSAFVQAIGYVLAGLGPLLFGALYGATGSWGLPITVQFVALAVMVAVGIPSTVPRYVDDELDPARRS